MWSVLDKIVILLWSSQRESVAAQRQGEPEQIDMILIFPLVPTLVPTPPGRRISKQNILALLHPAPGWLVVDRRDVCRTMHSVLKGG